MNAKQTTEAVNKSAQTTQGAMRKLDLVWHEWFIKRPLDCWSGMFIYEPDFYLFKII